MSLRKKEGSAPSKQDARAKLGQELLRGVQTLVNEKNIPEEVIFDAIERAVHLGIAKYSGDEEGITVTINRQNGVVTAQKGGQPVDPHSGELGRLTATAAKQMMIQMFREEESNSLVDRWDKRKGELVQGTVTRFEDGAALVHLSDKSEALLPRSEQVPGESHDVGERVKAIVLNVEKRGNRVKIVLSRAHPDFERRLFEKEIPEIDDGTISIKAVAREAGHRSKVAVASIDSKVDCVGACVGVRGGRIKNIVEVLGGVERIDIVRWNDSLQVLIPQALQPAEVEEVFLYPTLQRAVVLVREDQLSLASGRRGQNVRLASKLVDWEIEIMTHDELNGSIEKAEAWFRAIPGMTDEGVGVLIEEGFMSYEDVAVLSPAELSEMTGMSEDDADEALIFAEEEYEKQEKEAKSRPKEGQVAVGAGRGPRPSEGGEPPPSEARQKFDSLFASDRAAPASPAPAEEAADTALAPAEGEGLEGKAPSKGVLPAEAVPYQEWAGEEMSLADEQSSEALPVPPHADLLSHGKVAPPGAAEGEASYDPVHRTPTPAEMATANEHQDPTYQGADQGGVDGGEDIPDEESPGPAERRTVVSARIVRDSTVTAEVKRLHDFRCQVCGLRLETPKGPYAEGAHVRPLGSPHDGPDVPSNVLCLCPNHHVLFDGGVFSVRDDLTLLGIKGRLRSAPGHALDPAHLRYHRRLHGFEPC